MVIVVGSNILKDNGHGQGRGRCSTINLVVLTLRVNLRLARKNCTRANLFGVCVACRLVYADGWNQRRGQMDAWGIEGRLPV